MEIAENDCKLKKKSIQTFTENKTVGIDRWKYWKEEDTFFPTDIKEMKSSESGSA